jgi:adenylate cyclase
VLGSLASGGGRKDSAFAERRHGAVLLLDIAGFTGLTDTLAQRGARGAEELSEILNDRFAELVDIIDHFNGDVVAFAGDGLLGVWEDEDADRAATLAARCSLALQNTSIGGKARLGGGLQQRLAIEIGNLLFCRVGGFAGQWHHIVVGEPIRRVGSAYRRADPGDILLCRSARHAIAGTCEGDRIDDVFRLTRVTTSPRPSASVSGRGSPSGIEDLVPRVILDRAAVDEGRWLAEFRNLSIVSIKFPDFEFDDRLLPALQRGLTETQRVSARLEGTVYQVLMDDKGISAALCFGLPPFAHEDDSHRAVEAALALRREFRALGMPVAVGIASGRLFCGDYGGTRRRAYTVLGPASNLSARLMESAGNDVLCDSATAWAVSKRFTFTIIPRLHIKGCVEPISAFRPVDGIGERAPTRLGALVGRDAERAVLRKALQALLHGKGQVAVVEGEAGIGKSRILADLVETARSDGCRVLQSFATAIDKSTPYFAWRAVLFQMLDATPGTDLAVLRHRLLERLADNAMLLSWLPLLEDIVPLGLSQTALTAAITGAGRAASISEVLVNLLGQCAAAIPTVLVFDDLQWFDGASDFLLSEAARRLPQLLIIASRRVISAGAADASAARFSRDATIRLQALSRDAIAELIHQLLNVAQVPDALVSFVHHAADGNPFYSEELTLALRDTARLVVTRGTCHIQEELTASTPPALSSSLEAAIVSRIDALPHVHQLALKVASAIGSEFSLEMLKTIYPERLSHDDLVALLDRLVEHDLIRLRTNEPLYAFRHAISHDVTYNLLSFAQRRTLHGKIAASIEGLNHARLEPLYAQLARHWEAAEEGLQAIGYLERAAEQALRGYANRDAIRYLERAFQLARRTSAAIDEQRLSTWHAMLGDAHHEMADFEEASKYHERAMNLLGYRLPASRAELLRSASMQVIGQVARRLWRARPDALRPREREKLQRAAHIYGRLAEQYFFLNDSLMVLNGTLASLNLAERCGAATEIINGYSSLAIGSGMSGWVGAAHFYSRRALKLAEEHGGLPDIARAHLVAGVLGAGLGEWELVERCGTWAPALYQQLGDRTRWQNAQTMRVFVALLRSDLVLAEQLLHDLAPTVSPDSSIQLQTWSLCARVLIDSVRGSVAPRALTELLALSDAKQLRADSLLCFGVLAIAQERRGDHLGAAAAAERGLAVLKECRAVWAGFGCYGAGGVVEVLIAQWERALPDQRLDPKEPAAALTACRLLCRVARASPTCRPRSYILRGRASFLMGRVAPARRDWHRAIRAAQQLHMHYEVAVASYEIGRTAPRDDPTRVLHLARAEEIFERLGANDDLARAQRARAA